MQQPSAGIGTPLEVVFEAAGNEIRNYERIWVVELGRHQICL